MRSSAVSLVLKYKGYTSVLGLPNPLKKVTSAATAAEGMARAGVVLYQRKLLNPLRPDHGLKSVLNIAKYGPFAGVVLHAAQQHRNSVAIDDEIGPLTFGQLDEMSSAFARGLAQRGVKRGDVVAALCRDHRGMVLSMVAAGKLGVRVVLMNTGFAKPQFADVCKREKISAVLHDQEFLDLLSAIPSAIPRFLTWVDELDDVPTSVETMDGLMVGQSTKPHPAPSKPGGMIILTSGTTGTPKGAPRDKVSPLVSVQFLDRVPLPYNDVVMMAAPIFHGTGLSQFTLSLALANKVILRRRFNPEATLKAIAENKASTLVLVPTMLQRIIDLDPEIQAKYDTSSLKIIFASGSSVSPDLCIRTLERFGPVLHNLYGSTEVAVATVATPADLAKSPGTVGKPPVTVRCALYDADRKQVTKPNTIGTIFVASGLSFTGYTDGRNKEIVDGMLSTGDVGHFDEDGLWYVDGRDDDMIVSGGENVFPLEVENLLAERADVLEAAVVGVDDADFGKRLRAFVVPSKGSSKDAGEIKDYVKHNLARYKVPRDVVFIDELPRNATGKLLRSKLIEMEI